jgi:predicted CoA-binding protein
MNSPQPTVAIIGASTHRHKFGNKAVRAFRDAGWQVFPVNRRAGHIEGLAANAHVSEIPVALDQVSIYLHPADTLEALDGVAEVGPGEVWLNPGSDDPRVVARCQELGLNVRRGCSIVNVGMSPADYP